MSHIFKMSTKFVGIIFIVLDFDNKYINQNGVTYNAMVYIVHFTI
jgi:hypothetical protein